MMVLRAAVVTLMFLLLTSAVRAQGVVLPNTDAAPSGDWIKNVSARLRTGTTYFDLPSGSRVGGAYGFDLSAPLYEQWGGYAGLSVNHFSGGSQLLGTVGAYRTANPDSASLLDRLSGMLLFDQFADSRFGGLYISQLRVSLGYAFNRNVGAGIVYTEPLARDTVDSFFNPGFTSQVRSARSISGFASVRIRQAMLTGLVGYRDSGSAILGSRFRVPINNLVAAYSAAQYDSQGLWAASIGVEFDFGRRSSMWGIARRDRGRRVIRGQSPGSLLLTPWTDPTLGSAMVTGNLMGSSPMIESSSSRYSPVANSTAGDSQNDGFTRVTEYTDPHTGETTNLEDKGLVGVMVPDSGATSPDQSSVVNSTMDSGTRITEYTDPTTGQTTNLEDIGLVGVMVPDGGSTSSVVDSTMDSGIRITEYTDPITGETTNLEDIGLVGVMVP